MKNWKSKISLFLTSQGITLFGSSVVQFAIVWYVTRTTSSGFWVSMLTVCAYLPQFFISFFAGVWADKYSKKALIIGADAGIAVFTLLLAFLFPFISNNTSSKLLLILLLIISALRSIGTGIQTPTVSALIPELVPEEFLMKINGANSTIQSVVQFVAPAVAGIILSFCSFNLSLFIDVITAIAGIFLFSLVAIPEKSKLDENQKSPKVLDDMLAGLKYVHRESFVKSILLINGLFILLCVPAGFLCGLYVTRYYANSYAYLTAVEFAGFGGMAAGGLLMSTWGGFKNKMNTLIIGMISFGLLAAGMGCSKYFVLYLILMVFYGVSITMVQTATTTLLQESSKPEMQGRVFGLFGAIYSAFLPLGMIIFGPLADIIPLHLIMIGSGAGLLLLAALCMKVKHK